MAIEEPQLIADLRKLDLPESWVDTVMQAYKHVFSSRLRELNGDRSREWRGDGLHLLSHMWGAIDATAPEQLNEQLEGTDLEFSPMEVRRLAETAALDEFIARART